MDSLVRFLGGHPPFDALDDHDLRSMAQAAVVLDFAPGARILDAFRAPSNDLFVVLDGEVELWNSESVLDADETVARGAVFGFSAMLSRQALGPLAVALGPVRLARIPAAAVSPAFSSAAGLKFLAQNLATAVARPSSTSAYGIVDELIVSPPVIGVTTMTVADLAGLMTARNSGQAAIAVGDGHYGLVTDALLRSRVTAASLPPDTAISVVMDQPAPSVLSGTLAARALLELTDGGGDALLVVDRTGAALGILSRADFLVSPSTVGVSLREQIGRTATTEQLVVLARRIPLVLSDLLRRSRSAGEVTTVLSTVVDAVVRRAILMVFSRHPDLDAGELTWLALGSNGRREPLPSSDIDAAVVFEDSVAAQRMLLYRSAFEEVSAMLDRCGLSIDLHGTTPGSPLFSRTRSAWRDAATRWMNSPLQDNGMMMTSLLLDARGLQGDPGLHVVNDVFGDMHRHPRALRLLLAESLSHRARLRSMRDVLARRGGTFDIKTHALRPVIDIARWAAIAVGSREISTTARLTAAAGSAMVPQEQAEILIEVFDVLQRIRLRYQLSQLERGELASDVLSMRRLSPLDRSLIAQAVREIAAVQRRMSNLSQVSSPDSW